MRHGLIRQGGNQSACANIDHPQWDAISPSLRPYVLARMQKGLAQERHFGAEHLARRGGICNGVMEVWARLHQEKPDAAPFRRMELLMSEEGATHATIAQNCYAAELMDNAKALFKELREQGLPPVDSLKSDQEAEISNRSALYATQSTPLDVNPEALCEPYANLGKVLNNSPGYFDITIRFSNQDGEGGTHAIGAFSRGNHCSLTIFDSNLGECEVPEREIGRFMQAFSGFYESTRGYKLEEIRSIQKREFTDPISNTPLAQLAAQLGSR
jgi:hypothetical protein